MPDMLLLAISGLQIANGLIWVLFLGLSLLLILAILIQKPQGGGLAGAFGSGAGSGQTAFGAKTGDMLTIMTVSIFVIWLLAAIALNFWLKPATAAPNVPAASAPSSTPTGQTPAQPAPAGSPGAPTGTAPAAAPATGSTPPAGQPTTPPATAPAQPGATPPAAPSGTPATPPAAPAPSPAPAQPTPTPAPGAGR